MGSFGNFSFFESSFAEASEDGSSPAKLRRTGAEPGAGGWMNGFLDNWIHSARGGVSLVEGGPPP